MSRNTHLMILAILVVLVGALPVTAQEAEHTENDAPPEQTTHEEEQAEEAEHEEHGKAEGHGGRSHHKNDAAIFLGGTDEHGHPTEFTWGLDYKRRVAEHWAVGGLFDYAGGLRNAIVAASVTWWHGAGLSLTAAPGIEFHRGRSSSEGCDCGGSTESEETGEHGEADEDATYFVVRLGVGWGFPIGESYIVEPQVNLDLVEGEKVWVYGVNFIYAW